MAKAGGACPTSCAVPTAHSGSSIGRSQSRSKGRVLSAIIAAGLIAASFGNADAAVRKVRVPDKYDGAWSITAITKAGPCSASTSYQVRIKGRDASVPGNDIDIDGGVSARGTVRATIRKGSTRVPITGSLDVGGSGSGTWSTSGGLLSCSGSWTARRSAQN